MADDIIEIKPGVGPFKFNVRALARSILGGKADRPADVVAERFKALFEAHGVPVTQIPRFIASVSLRDLNENDTLLAALSPQILEQSAALFGIQRAWIEGTTARIYPPHSCYKRPRVLFELLARVTWEPHSCPVRVLTLQRSLDCTSRLYQPLVLVVVEKLAPADDIDQIWDIERYHVFSDGWDWGHAGARIQLKAMARVVNFVVHENVPIFHVPRNALDAVRNGARVPRDFVANCLLTNPSLEDFACTSEESAVAKEVEELPLVRDYIAKHSLPTSWPPGIVP